MMVTESAKNDKVTIYSQSIGLLYAQNRVIVRGKGNAQFPKVVSQLGMKTQMGVLGQTNVCISNRMWESIRKHTHTHIYKRKRDVRYQRKERIEWF